MNELAKHIVQSLPILSNPVAVKVLIVMNHHPINTSEPACHLF